MSIYTQMIGNGAATSFSIPATTHGLSANQSLFVEVVEASSGRAWDVDVTISSSGTVTLNFSVAPTSNQFQVNVAG